MSIYLKTEIPGPKSRALMLRRKEHVARGPFHVTPIFVDRAEGAILQDVDGNQLLDFASGIGVTNVGHTHPIVVEALQKQLQRFLHVGVNVTPYESYIALAEKLNEKTPGSFPKKTFLANSGAEAVENAIKIARAFTGKEALICFDHAFHGRTYMAMTLTSKYKPYKYDFDSFCPEVYRTPYPYGYRWPTSSDSERVSEECFKYFEELVCSRLSPTKVAAVIIEPVLGEGGFVPAPPSFLKRLRKFCSEHNIVFIADEIQTGFGRTGTLFACEQLSLEPDLIITAKGLGGGLPLSAVTGKAEIMDAPIEGGIGGTFNGNPLSCVAALAVFEIFEKENLFIRSQNITQQLISTLKKLQNEYSLIGDVRGLGPMQAMEWVKSSTTKEPDPEITKKIIQTCYEKGLILMSAGTYSNVIRFLVPLVIKDEELQEGLAVVEKVIRDCR